MLPQNVSDGEEISYPIGLMDGAIDDNQGVGGIIIGEEKMKRYPKESQAYTSVDDKAVDLYLISDASAPKIERFNRKQLEPIRFIGNLTFESLKYFGIMSAIVGVCCIILAYQIESITSIVALTIFATLGLISAGVLLLLSLGMTNLARKMGIPELRYSAYYTLTD